MPQKLHFTSLLTLTRWSVLALSVGWLSGCAYAPGLSISKGLQTAESTSSSHFSSTSDSAGNEVPPPGALLSITPELIYQQRALQKTGLGADVKRLFGEGKPYSIGSGDVINIVVWDHPELVLAPAGSTSSSDASSLAAVGNGYNVSPEGLIQFPLLGTVKVAGLTENKARIELTKRLSKFIRDPQVTLRVQAYRAGRIYIDGEVRTPGLQAINDIPMTLPEAISRAGGLTAVADRSSVAISRHGTTTLINMPKLAALGINPSHIMLATGDLVRVGSSEDSKVYVMGEVTRPTALPLHNGRLTLNEALGESGGINSASGDPRQIYVIRSRSNESAVEIPTSIDKSGRSAMPEIYHLNASSPVAYALAEGFELKSRDVVFVDPVPLVLWNRVVSLILPSAQAANSTKIIK